MAEAFDPYHKWLGIPPKDQPPNHYRLLGIDLFESDPDVIAAAADQRMGHVRTFQTGKNSALSQKILNEIAAVRVCLLSREKKAEYDRKLRHLTARRARPNQRVKLAVDSAKPAVQQAVGGGTPAINVPRISSVEPSSARYVSRRKKQSWQAVGALLVAAAVCAGIAAFVALWSRDRGSGHPATHVGQPPPGPEPTGGGDATGPEGGTGPGADRSRQTDGKQPVQEPKAHVAAEERLKELLKSNSGATTPAQFRNIVKRSLELVDQALLNGQDEVAKRAVTVAVGAARKAEDNQLTKTATLRYLDLGLQTGPPRSVGAYLQLQDAIAVLEENPVDPAANLAMGRHLCFANRDWEQGIPMLALGSDPR